LGLLDPFDHLLSQIAQGPKDGLSIPQPLFNIRLNSLDDLRPFVRALAPLFGIQVGSFLFPADGWMNAAWRLGVLAAGHQRSQIPLPDKLHGPLADKRGPLGNLAAAEFLRAADTRFESLMYAGRDVPWHSVTVFREECRELVSGEGFLSEVLLKTAATMRQLDPADVEALSQLFVELELLDDQQAAVLELAALRAHEADTPMRAASEALNAIWRAGLSKWIERRLLDELREGSK